MITALATIALIAGIALVAGGIVAAFTDAPIAASIAGVLGVASLVASIIMLINVDNDRKDACTAIGGSMLSTSRASSDCFIVVDGKIMEVQP